MKLTVREATEILGVKEREVRRLIETGRLKSTRVGTMHLLDRRSVEAYRRRPRGRPTRRSLRRRRKS
jgi:excisionase family DNA binding protein